jgi:hypothetical protein
LVLIGIGLGERGPSGVIRGSGDDVCRAARADRTGAEDHGAGPRQPDRLVERKRGSLRRLFGGSRRARASLRHGIEGALGEDAEGAPSRARWRVIIEGLEERRRVGEALRRGGIDQPLDDAHERLGGVRRELGEGRPLAAPGSLEGLDVALAVIGAPSA